LFLFYPRKKEEREVVIKKVRLVCEKDREVRCMAEESKRRDLKNFVWRTATEMRIGWY
jgi:hypothetical protein